MLLVNLVDFTLEKNPLKLVNKKISLSLDDMYIFLMLLNYILYPKTIND
jgi:hypothetical protein